ncbi:MAG: hypothetical protein KC457_07090 [Myxococcales bacterium]|nr:hypothetical protein [Myxococcales bacterium]
MIVSLCSLVACKGEEAVADKPTGERRAEPEPETPKDAEGGPFAGFDFEAARARMQGAWVVAGPGGRVAWSISDDALIEYADQREHKYDFSLYSPCQVALTDVAAGETTYRPFAFVDGALHVGIAAPMGVVAGSRAIVCAGGHVYVLDGDACREWSEMFDDWKSKAADCRIEGEGEARRFVVGEDRLRFVGGAILGEAGSRDRAEAHPDFAAAKAALAVTAAADGDGGGGEALETAGDSSGEPSGQ